MLINIFGTKLTALLNDFSGYWHIGGVFLMAILLAFFGRHSQPNSFLFQSAVNADLTAYSTFAAGLLQFESIMMGFLGKFYAGGGLALAFVLGLLQAQWIYTGYDASAHVAEETVMARLNSAWVVFLSVAVSFVVGYVMLIILTLHIPGGMEGVPTVVAPPDGTPSVPYIAYSNFDNVWFGHIIALIFAVAMWLCGLSSITSMSHMWFAFARDGGMPGYSLIRQIHPKWRTPIWSIVITSVLAVLLTIYSAVYSVIVAVSTTALYLAYGIPIYLNARNKMRKKGEYTTSETAPWSLIGWGTVINWIAVAWVAFITILFSIPPNELAGWSVILMGVFMFFYWQMDAKHRFSGPKVTAEEELRRIEAEMIMGAVAADD